MNLREVRHHLYSVIIVGLYKMMAIIACKCISVNIKLAAALYHDCLNGPIRLIYSR